MPDEQLAGDKDRPRFGRPGRRARSWLVLVGVFATIAVLGVLASDALRRTSVITPALPGEEGERDPAASLAVPSRSPRVEARRTTAPDDPDPLPLERGVPDAEERSVATFVIEGRVVDDSGRPIETARVFVGLDQSCSAEPVATSDADGAFRAEVGSESRPYPGFDLARIFVACEGWTTVLVEAEVHAGTTLRLGEIVLAPGANVTGHVVDENGRPVEGAGVGYRLASELPGDLEEARRVGFPSSVGFRRCPDAVTDASGAFCLRGVAAGDVFLVAWAREKLFSATEILALRRGDCVEKTIRLLPDARARWNITGRVLLPDGRTLLQAEVRWGKEGSTRNSRSLRTVDGTFVLMPRDPEPLWIEACDPSGHWYPARLDTVAPGTRDLEIMLGEPRWLTIALQDEAGDSIPWGHVTGRGEEGFALTAAGSTGEARVLRPRLPFSVKAFAPGFRTEEFGPYDPAEVDERLVLTLTPGEALEGRVVSRGFPVAAARLQLSRCIPPGRIGWSASATTLENAFTLLAGTGAREQHDATTDPDGRFVATLHDSGWHRIRVEAEGFPTHFTGPFEFSREAGSRGLEIELAEGGAIEGHVLEATGTRQRRVVGVSNGWGVAHTALVDDDGFYRIEDLQPGSYQVRPCVEPVGSRAGLGIYGVEEGVYEADCSVLAGETTRFDLDLRSEGAFLLEGRIDLRGHATDGSASLSALDSDARRSRSLAYAEIDESGSFRMALSRGGTFLLEARVSGATFYSLVDLTVGITEWSASIETGALRFPLAKANESVEALAGLSVFWDGGDVRYQVPARRASTDGDDGILPGVPSGRVHILRIPEGDIPTMGRGWHDPRTWRLVREIEVRAGEETIVELPR